MIDAKKREIENMEIHGVYECVPDIMHINKIGYNRNSKIKKEILLHVVMKRVNIT